MENLFDKKDALLFDLSRQCAEQVKDAFDDVACIGGFMKEAYALGLRVAMSQTRYAGEQGLVNSAVKELHGNV